MSRSITIPDYKNPFVVIINNNVYQYRGGDTVEVPDEVAEAIEDALDEIPRPKIYLSKLAQLAEGSLTKLTPSDLEGVIDIYSFAFYGCDRFQSVTLPDSVKSIGNSAFRFCGKLKRLEVPKGVLNIDDKAFDSCTSLESVIVKALTPPSIKSDTFASVSTTCVFEVPLEALNAYKSAQYWSALASQIKAIEE